MTTNLTEQLIGTWQLESFTLHNLTLKKQYYPYGDKPVGLLLLGADGYMSVTVMAAERPLFAGETLQGASPEEKIRAVETYLSYGGKWRVEDNRIYVYVTVSLLPNWTQKEHFRNMTLTEKALVFQTPVIRQKDTELMIELTWTKL